MSKANLITVQGRKFTVNELKAGQTAQLQEVFNINLFEGLDPEYFKNEIANDVGKLVKFVAIVVKEEGVELKDKDLNELTDFFMFSASTLDIKNVIAFLPAVWNPKLEGRSTNRKSTASSSKTKKK